MISNSEPMELADNFYCLGPSVIPSFLLLGDKVIVFEAGIYHFGPHYHTKIKEQLGGREPDYLFLTHMHFDHCGAAGYLKRFFPGMKICASKEGKKIIEKPSARKLIAKLNSFGHDPKDSFEDFSVDRVLEDGEIIEAGDSLHVEVIKTPGHTRDMLSFYIQELKAMIPSESVGVPAGDYIFSEFLIDYDIYMNSLERLGKYDIDILLIAHGLYFTGEDARNFIPRAIPSARLFKKRILELLDQYDNDHRKIAAVIKSEEYDPLPQNGRQPEEAYMLNLMAKIKAVSKLRGV